MSKHKFAVYLGNLRPDVRARHHKINIIHLFNALHIDADKHVIEIFYNGKDEPAYAYIDLDNERDQRYAIKTISDLASEETEEFEHFEYDALVIEGEELRVSAKDDMILKKYGRNKKNSIGTASETMQPKQLVNDGPTAPMLRNAKFKKRRSKGNYRYANTPDSNRRPRSREPSPAEEERTTDLIKSLRPVKTYQEEWLERLQLGAQGFSIHNPGRALVDSELPDTSHSKGVEEHRSFSEASDVGADRDSYSESNMPERYYVRGEHVGKENRTTEFKMKSGLLPKEVIKNVVEKYVVSFLNSAGGTLMLGVDDNGIACGGEFSQEDEDAMRLVIDDAVRGIQPLVTPDLYSVHFVPVQVDGKCKNVKIVKITVQSGNNDRRYMTKGGEIFVRGDGGIQELEPGEVQQWGEGASRASQKARCNETLGCIVT